MLIDISIQEMAQADILRYISPITLDAIRSRDSKPLFRAYCVGHTGESQGRMIGIGNVVKKWYNHAIEKLFDKIGIGTKIFKAHRMDSNEHAGRQVIGEVVGKTIEKVGDKLRAIAITWLKPEYRSEQLDVASIEGDIRFTQENENVIVDDVTQISGLALGTKGIDNPGFPEATLEASIQMFHENKTTGEKIMTLEELKKLIQEAGHSPSDIFGEDVIKEDPYVKGFLEEIKTKVGNKLGYQLRKEADALQEKEAKLTEQNRTLLDENKTLKMKVMKTEAAPKLLEHFEKRKLDDIQKKFVNKKFESFTPTEDIDKELNNFIDKSIDEYKELSTIFGIKQDQPAAQPQTTPQTQQGITTRKPEPVTVIDLARNPMGLLTDADVKDNPLI